MKRLHLLLSISLVSAHQSGFGQQKRAIEPSDCVTVRYLDTGDTYDLYQAIAVSPQGDRLAYLVKSPNIATDRNETELYVKDLTDNAIKPAVLVKSSPSDMSGLQWLADGRHVAVLESQNDRRVVAEIDITNSTEAVIARAPSDITEFSIAKNNSALVLATDVPTSALAGVHSALENVRGYRIPFVAATLSASELNQRKLFLSKRNSLGEWSSPTPLVITSPLDGVKMATFPYNMNSRLSMSPDGSKFLASYVSGDLPSNWWLDPTVKKAKANGFPGATVTILYSLKTGNATMPFKSTGSWMTPVWAPDSASYMTLSWSPVGSRWIAEDERQNIILTDPGLHLFWIAAETGNTEEIAKTLADIHDQPVLSWTPNGEVLVRMGANVITRFSRQDGQWRDIGKIFIPVPDFPNSAQMTSDGNRIFGDYQQVSIPPQLFSYKPGDSHIEVFEKLNPQFDHLTLAPTEKVQWKTASGYIATGMLFLPTDFMPGKRYPLVIGTKGGVGDGQFQCDSGSTHAPSFAPQPIANAGIIYLSPYSDGIYDERDELKYYPKGYPGGVAEAAFQFEQYDSAVRMLDRRGLIDPDKVGIIGFSRSGWYTEFALAHGTVRYRAATVADNVEYTMGEYWLSAEAMGGYDAMYGGSPYGKALRNWMGYSISFNLEKIHTPILMEIMGHGAQFDRDDRLPINLAERYEVFSGLNHLGKPVELYFYPDEHHEPEDPQARLASLQRNLDWYRFWLQGYERPNPEDQNQYVRWRHLRQLQDTENTHPVESSTMP